MYFPLSASVSIPGYQENFRLEIVQTCSFAQGDFRPTIERRLPSRRFDLAKVMQMQNTAQADTPPDSRQYGVSASHQRFSLLQRSLGGPTKGRVYATLSDAGVG